ncbi:hypothetical protein E2493_18145 [Sphingomonas parva]|uniref:DUF2269 family protein n=1 Tax=Sphingomonas parva TaxID=2555898 RepID=A0A4Y8ZNY3_9SPHN|nr:hypothetical protein [Sphingomonas parva]TFI56865.1 hypothetical protein E2493_18145 [Sphingomonas parva]
MPFDHLLSAHKQTLWLAPVVGSYLCLSSVGLLRQGESRRLTADLRDHPGAMHAVGAIAFFVGAALLSLHRHWATPPEIAVNLVAIWWTFEGAGMLLEPERLRSRFARSEAAKQLRVASLVSIPLGVYLLLVGLLGRAT